MSKTALRCVYGLLIAVATLNRNSSILLVLAYVAVMWPMRRHRGVQAWAVVYAGIWAGVYGALVIGRPAHSEWITPAAVLALNVSWWGLQQSIPANAVFVPLAALVILNARRAPEALTRLLWIMPVYAVPVLIYGAWNEVRLWLPVLPIVLALGLSSYRQAKYTNAANEARFYLR